MTLASSILLSELLMSLPEEREAFLAAHPHPSLLLEPFGWEPWGESDPDIATLAWKEATPRPESFSADALTPEDGSSVDVVASASDAPGSDLIGHLLADSLHPATRLEWLVPRRDADRPLQIVTLGRGRKNDIPIPNLSISKTQTVFLRDNGRWMVEDDGSSNGTFLNGRRLRNHTIYELTDGDTLSFGMVVKGRFLRPESLWLLCDKLRKVAGDLDELARRRSLEEQLLQAQRMEMIGRLSGSVAHDFNNLLTVIQGHLELLREGTSEADPRQQNLAAIGKAADRAGDLTRQLLTFSRRQRVSAVTLQLNDVITAAEPLVRGLLDGRISLTLDLDPDLKPVLADPYQLEQVVMNLALNARDAMVESGGALTIQTRNVERSVSFDPGDTAHEVMLTVKDTGHGIDADTMPFIFEPFFTTREVGQGSGLGLSTVYGIVQQSRGHVTVRSDGAGSTFEVVFPALLDRDLTPLAPHRIPHTLAPTERQSRTILVVEDEDGVRELLAGVLERAGYTVISAPGPALAKQLVLQHGASIDLLLTDIVMPDESGIQLASFVKAQVPGIKVIYVSGYTRDAMHDNEQLSEDETFLEKPFLPNTLRRIVDDVLA